MCAQAWRKSSGGAESNESAFKFARYYWKRMGKPDKVKIVSRRYGYHGVTMAAMSATSLPNYHKMFGPLVPEFLQEEVHGAALGAALLHEIEDPEHVSELSREFHTVHQVLRRGGAERAATAILECVRGREPHDDAHSQTGSRA